MVVLFSEILIQEIYMKRSEERRVGKESSDTRWPRDWSSDVCSSDLSHYDSWTEEQLEDLEKLIDYIKEKEVPIVNLQDGFNMRGNIFDQENLKITRDGRIVQ